MPTIHIGFADGLYHYRVVEPTGNEADIEVPDAVLELWHAADELIAAVQKQLHQLDEANYARFEKDQIR